MQFGKKSGLEISFPLLLPWGFATSLFLSPVAGAISNDCVKNALTACQNFIQLNSAAGPTCETVTASGTGYLKIGIFICYPHEQNCIRGDWTSGDVNWLCLSDMPIPPAPPPPPSTAPAIGCGSIIHFDNQALGESVPVGGTPYSLVYFSDRVIGSSSSFTLQIPLTAPSVPSQTTSTLLTIQYLGRTFTQSFPPTPNQVYSFQWDGLDALGKAFLGSALAQITVANTYSDSTQDIPIQYSQPVGRFQAMVDGLGGWTLSVHHFYDFPRGQLEYGDGNIRPVAAYGIPKSSNSMVASADGSEAYIFDPTGKHLQTLNGLTGSVILSFSYDSKNRLAAITDAYGNVTQVVRNSQGILTGIKAPYGQLTSLSLDKNGYLASIQNPASEIYAMTYSAGGLLQTFQKPLGQVSTLTYDPSTGALLKDANSAGNSLSLNLQSSTSTLQASSALNRMKTFSFSTNGNQTTRVETTPDGITRTLSLMPNVSRFFFQTSDLSVSEYYSQDIRFGSMANFTQSRTIQNAGQTLTQSGTQTLSGASSASPSPFSFGTLDTQITANGSSTTDILYTASTQQAIVTSPMGRKISQATDVFGKPVSVTLGNLSPTQLSYDLHGKVNKIIQGSRTSTLAYTTLGDLQSVTNALGQVTRFSYDTAGRVITQTLPDSRKIQYAYDANGNLTQVTPPGKLSHGFLMNLFDLVASYLPPALGGSQPTSTQYSYNNDRQLTQIQKPSGSTIQLNYDPAQGTLTSITLPTGQANFTSFQGFITQAQSSDGVSTYRSFAGTALTSEAMAFSYANSGFNSSLSKGYDSFFRLSSSQISGGGIGGTSAISFGYDSDGILTQAGDENYVADAGSGILIGTRLGQITQAFTYDSTYGELISSSASSTPSGGNTKTLFSQSYTRDALGRIVSRSETVNGVSHAYTYTFDKAGRLTTVTQDGKAWSQYGYDSNSNRASGYTGGTDTSKVTIHAQYDAQDRLVSYGTKAYTFDLDGNLNSVTDSSSKQTTQYTFDALGELKTVQLPGKRVDYRVDGFGRRVLRAVNGRFSAMYVYEDKLRIGAVLDVNGNVKERFVYGSRPNVPDFMILKGQDYQLLTDPNGSVRLVVNTATGAIAEQISYDEFGNVLSDSNPGLQPFGFAGGLYDPDTKLTHFGAREYDAGTGRWVSKDPLLFWGGQTNIYGYSFNDPVNFIDPSGKIAGVDDAVFIGGVIIATGVTVGLASGIANYQTTHSISSAKNAFGSGLVSGASSAGVAVLATSLGAGSFLATSAATAFDLAYSFLTAPTSIPNGSAPTFLNGVKASSDQQQASCPGN